ncbi:hypothetical protein KGQ71_05085, partial [Patescibacteria group bacterium]|nr:hypothetical protein [Patescibacteria group bacterium]
MPVYQSVALNQATPSPTAFPVSPSASLPVTGLATALPTTQPTQSPSTQSTQSSTLSSPSPSPVSTPNSLSRIQLASTLSDFSQTHTATAATGIRNPNDTVSFLDLLIPRAKADNGVYGTRAYPAVYFADSNSIKEINVYTGETRTILSEPNPILVVTFSSAYQTLIYTTNANDSRSYPPVAVRSYNLNTGQKTTVGTTYMHSGKLSPSGTEFAYFQTTADNPSNGQALLAYHLDDRTTQTITAQSTIGLPTYYQSEFSWSDDNTLVVDQFTYRGVNSDKNLDGQILAKKINLSHPDTAILISDRSPIMFYSSLLVHNR